MSDSGNASITEPGRRRMSKVGRGAALLGGLAATGAIGLLIGLNIAARDASGTPSASPVGTITMPVEARTLADVRTLNCTATRNDLNVAAGEAYGGSPPVVTNVFVRNGATVRSGAAVVEVSGRPVIALQGAFPLYRDLRQGDKGVDVRALQAGLQSAGVWVGADGVFGAGTERALRRLYRKVGYAVPTESVNVTVPATAALQGVAADGYPGGRPKSGSGATPTPSRGTTPSTPAVPASPGAAANPGATTTKTIQRVYAPKSELVMLANLPAVKTGGSAIGSVPSSKLLTIKTAVPAVACSADNTDGLKSGQKVTLEGVSAPATITSVDTAANQNTDDQGAWGGQDPSAGSNSDNIKISLPSAALTALPDGSVQGQVTVRQTKGDVLVVPLGAIGGSESNPVVVLVKDGQKTEVPVTTGLDVDGSVEVAPKQEGALNVDDEIVITG